MSNRSNGLIGTTTLLLLVAVIAAAAFILRRPADQPSAVRTAAANTPAKQAAADSPADADQPTASDAPNPNARPDTADGALNASEDRAPAEAAPVPDADAAPNADDASEPATDNQTDESNDDAWTQTVVRHMTKAHAAWIELAYPSGWSYEPSELSVTVQSYPSAEWLDRRDEPVAKVDILTRATPMDGALDGQPITIDGWPGIKLTQEDEHGYQVTVQLEAHGSHHVISGWVQGNAQERAALVPLVESIIQRLRFVPDLTPDDLTASDGNPEGDDIGWLASWYMMAPESWTAMQDGEALTMAGTTADGAPIQVDVAPAGPETAAAWDSATPLTRRVLGHEARELLATTGDDGPSTTRYLLRGPSDTWLAADVQLPDIPDDSERYWRNAQLVWRVLTGSQVTLTSETTGYP